MKKNSDRRKSNKKTKAISRRTAAAIRAGYDRPLCVVEPQHCRCTGECG
jgi:triosephosphate isomerase